MSPGSLEPGATILMASWEKVEEEATKLRGDGKTLRVAKDAVIADLDLRLRLLSDIPTPDKTDETCTE